MTGMENVLAAHVATTHNISGNTDGGHQSRRCQCGSEVTAYYSEMADDADDLRLYLNAKFAAHVAEALSAAGFGNLHDAWAEGHRTPVQRERSDCQCRAWCENECACGKYGTGKIVTPNPYRK